MAASLVSLFFILPLLFHIQVSANNLVFEEGYTVTTVFDGNKLNVNPHSILPQFGSSDFAVLDSEKSALYTVSVASSEVGDVKRLSGNGAGFKDGDLATAMFKNPKSIAVDLNGNVYVADKGNLAVRKISKSGVTTIAGYSEKPGHADGPARNASFSTDFELTFVPQMCALMICDHGNKLIRQINLKPEDCARGSQSGLGSSAWTWVLAVGVSCLVGMAIGFAVRPYVTPHGGRRPLSFKGTWKHYLIRQGKQVATLCFDFRNVIVSSTMFTVPRSFLMLSLSQLSLMFTIKFNPVGSHQPRTSSVTSAKQPVKPLVFPEQLQDLITFESPDVNSLTFESPVVSEGEGGVCDGGNRNIEKMMQANLMDFVKLGEKSSLAPESCLSGSGLVKRK